MRERIASVADKMSREWLFFRGTGAIYPGDQYFWLLAEQEIAMGLA